jgi:2-methylcitrate dehydratase PrpD
LQDPRTRALMERIQLRIDPELDATFPRQRAARVAITAGGRREEHLQPTRKGDPDAPLTDADVNDKFLELASPVLGAEQAKRRLDELWAIG